MGRRGGKERACMADKDSSKGKSPEEVMVRELELEIQTALLFL